MSRSINIGLDFGTTYTKCVFRDELNNKVWPVSFHSNGKRTYFLDSFVTISKDSAGHSVLKSPLQSSIQTDFKSEQGTRRYLKVRLLRAAIESPRNRQLLDDAKRNAAFYLSHVLFGVLDSIHTWSSNSNVEMGQLDLLVQMCMPDRHSDQGDIDSDARKEFKSALSTAFYCAKRSYEKAIESGFAPGDPPSSFHLPTIEEIDASLNPDSYDDRCKCVSETYAISRTVIANKAVPSGFFFIVDVGGGTVDISLVNIDRKKSQPMNIYDNEVIFQGSTVFDIGLKKCFPELSLKQVINLKEGRKSGLPAGFDIEAFRLEKTRIAKSVHDDTARLLGDVLWRSLHYWGPLFITNSHGRVEENPDLWPTAKRSDFRNFRYIFLGNGFTPDPYELACRFFYKTQYWDIDPQALMLLKPDDFVGIDHTTFGFSIPNQVSADPMVMRRFAVAYGLSFEADVDLGRDSPAGNCPPSPIRPTPFTGGHGAFIAPINPAEDYTHT